MRTRDDVESYLIAMDLPWERLAEDIWVVYGQAEHIDNLVVAIVDRLVTFRMKLFELGARESVALLRQLLEYNGTEMIHGAYALEGDAVVLTATLELENLDMNEFRAVFDSFAMATATHYPSLASLLSKETPSHGV